MTAVIGLQLEGVPFHPSVSDVNRLDLLHGRDRVGFEEEGSSDQSSLTVESPRSWRLHGETIHELIEEGEKSESQVRSREGRGKERERGTNAFGVFVVLLDVTEAYAVVLVAFLNTSDEQI